MTEMSGRTARNFRQTRKVKEMNDGNSPKPETTLEPGYWVAMVVREGAEPGTGVYVGVVQAVDPRGVRLTLIDWIIGTACGWDLFVPWPDIRCCLIATPEHDVEHFGKAGAEWQEAMKRLRTTMGGPVWVPAGENGAHAAKPEDA